MSQNQSIKKRAQFHLGRVVDPFLSDEKLRSEYLNELSEKIKTQESTEIAMSVKLLTHRMLSPDQNEAANALNVSLSILIQFDTFNFRLLTPLQK